jgi:hypothetical protein
LTYREPGYDQDATHKIGILSPQFPVKLTSAAWLAAIVVQFVASFSDSGISGQVFGFESRSPNLIALIQNQRPDPDMT